MNYDQTLEYLFKQLPVYQRDGKAAYKADLNTTIKLDKYFSSPHKKYKTIHIAGTNGKGSVAHSLASILQETGLKVGLYTSPHYLDFRERIRINGQPVNKDFVVDFVEQHSNYFLSLKPSFFEITVAMAFEYFAQQNVDIAVIEVGMGGRLDSTNIITPIASVITNIGFDHTQFLGTELSSIAKEKAEIIKKNIPVIVSENKPNLKLIFSQKAQQVDAPLYFSGHNYAVQNYYVNDENQLVFNIDKHGKLEYSNLIFGLSGEYQRFNILTILQTVEVLKAHINILDQNIFTGLKNVVQNTGIMGRWQILSTNPRVICDAGHNYDGILNVTEQLKSLKYNKLHIVFGTVNDKDISKILKLLPQDAEYYFTKASINRALNEETLKNSGQNFGLLGESYMSVNEAITSALQNKKENDLIFIGGSTFIVAEAIEFFNINKNR